jgi:hypothetical protein
MLSDARLREIESQVLKFWRDEVKKDYFVRIAQGKEIGHKLADLVDEKTTAVITCHNLTKHQVDSEGTKRSRSMGDVWVEGKGIYHPVNVKTGVVGSEGQPNMVSLKKVIDAILARCIDSYYLLIVKMEIGEKAIAPAVFMIDMLDYFPFLTFDSGPGQIMLKAVRFFEDYERYAPPKASLKDKLDKLMALYEDGERRLRLNRERDLHDFRGRVAAFLKSDDWSVTAETQRALLLK